MQGDLISRSALIEKFKDILNEKQHNSIFRIFLLETIEIVEKQPTAYDVEKVIAELNEEEIALEDNYGDYVLCVPTRIAEQIVRNGGKE